MKVIIGKKNFFSNKIRGNQELEPVFGTGSGTLKNPRFCRVLGIC
jgi:hypothetical protein